MSKHFDYKNIYKKWTPTKKVWGECTKNVQGMPPDLALAPALMPSWK